MKTFESISALLEKWFYETITNLLPGALLYGVILASFPKTTLFAKLAVMGGEVGAIVFCYVAGVTLQGVASLPPMSWILRQPAPRPSKSEEPRDPSAARRDASRLLHEAVQAAMPESLTSVAGSEQAAVALCLSHVGVNRTVFDKFTALRDMARGLSSAVFLSFLLGGAALGAAAWAEGGTAKEEKAASPAGPAAPTASAGAPQPARLPTAAPIASPLAIPAPTPSAPEIVPASVTSAAPAASVAAATSASATPPPPKPPVKDEPSAHEKAELAKAELAKAELAKAELEKKVELEKKADSFLDIVSLLLLLGATFAIAGRAHRYRSVPNMVIFSQYLAEKKMKDQPAAPPAGGGAGGGAA